MKDLWTGCAPPVGAGKKCHGDSNHPTAPSEVIRSFAAHAVGEFACTVAIGRLARGADAGTV